MTYADRNPDPEFGQAQIIAGLNQLMGSPQPLLIIGFPTSTQK